MIVWQRSHSEAADRGLFRFVAQTAFCIRSANAERSWDAKSLAPVDVFSDAHWPEINESSHPVRNLKARPADLRRYPARDRDLMQTFSVRGFPSFCSDFDQLILDRSNSEVISAPVTFRREAIGGCAARLWRG